MKKIITTLMSLIMSTGLLSAHDYYPLVREGVEWECTATYLNYGESKEFDYSIKIIGDSVVDGVSYKKCYYLFANDAFSCNNHAVALLREDVVNQKVYMRLTEKAALCDPFISFSVETEQPEMLLYDFGNINNNEQYWIGWDPEELQAEVIMSNGILLNNYENYIIEGIGCIEEPRDPFTIGGGEISGYPKYHLRVNRYIDENGNVMYDRNYHRLVREGVRWHCRMDVVSAITETESYPYTIEIKGDTIINDVIYKKCYYTFQNESVATNDIPRAFLREDIGEKKVYALYNYDYTTTLPFYPLGGYFESFTEGLLYDFNDLANTNQGWHEFMRNGEGGITTETITLNSKEYVKTTVNNMYVFIEGIGFVEFKDLNHEGDFLYPSMPRLASAFSPEALPIFCSFEDETGKVIYTSEMAHNYIPLVREGVRWHCLEARITYFPPHGEYVPFYIEIKGDSIVDDVVWKKCYCVFEDSISPAILLREDISTQRVYAHGLRHTMCEGNLLYDFKNITDPYHIWNWSLLFGVEPTLVSESVIDIDGKDHRYYEVTSRNTIIPVIEGIGAIGVHKYSDGYIDYEGNFLYPIPIKIVGGDDVFPIFLHLSDLDGRIIYDGPADIDDFKNTKIEENIENKKNKVNVINRSINISSVEEIKSVRIINMAGMVVDVASPNGNTITIPTDKYPAGCYIIQVATESDITTQKISI